MGVDEGPSPPGVDIITRPLRNIVQGEQEKANDFYSDVDVREDDDNDCGGDENL